MPDMEVRMTRIENHAAVCDDRWVEQRADNTDTCSRLSTLADLVTALRLDLKSLAVKASIYFAILVGVATILGPVIVDRLLGR